MHFITQKALLPVERDEGWNSSQPSSSSSSSSILLLLIVVLLLLLLIVVLLLLLVVVLLLLLLIVVLLRFLLIVVLLLLLLLLLLKKCSYFSSLHLRSSSLLTFSFSIFPCLSLRLFVLLQFASIVLLHRPLLFSPHPCLPIMPLVPFESLRGT